MSTERIVVQRSIAEKFAKMLADTSDKVFGKDSPAPVLVSAGAVTKNKDLVSDAVAKGANVVFGDAKANEQNANSMRPVIVQDVTKDMSMYTQESFGPTVSLMVVETEDDAVTQANDTEYGLTSAVFTNNLFRGLRVAKQIETGYVSDSHLLLDLWCMSKSRNEC